jgi:hypothetical protein
MCRCDDWKVILQTEKHFWHLFMDWRLCHFAEWICQLDSLDQLA